MVKVEATQQFTLGKFNEIKNINRKGADKPGMIFVGDTFECTPEMAKYLTGENDKNISVVKVIEVIPEVVEKAPVVEEEKPVVEESKPIKKTTKKKTSKK